MQLNMDFFDKVRVTLSSPLKGHYSDTRDFKTWSLPTSHKFENIRLLLYRDCERRGRKCLFDSAHVIKDSKTCKYTYIPVTNTGQVKDLCEWIFGCVPLSSASTKRFHRLKGNLIWSRTFQVPLMVETYKTFINFSDGASSHVSPNGELTSSGYTSSSEIEDSSYEKLLTNSSKNWRLQNSDASVYPEKTHCTGLKLSHSLPSHLEGATNKIVLGVAIVVPTGDEDDVDGGLIDARECKQLGEYIVGISSELELSTDWFASIAIQSYLNPSTFVERLYNFSKQYRELLIGRLTNPLANVKIIPLSVKHLPVTIGEFLTAYMINDLWWIKCHPVPKRCKIVIVAHPRKLQEVKSVLTVLKLINQCACGKIVDAALNVSSVGVGVFNNSILEHRTQLQSNSRSTLSTSVAATKADSPENDEIGMDVMTLNPEDIVQDSNSKGSQVLKQVSTKDSGISSILSSTASLKRSPTSENFYVNTASTSPDYTEIETSNSDSGVCFHLGEEPGTEQTFSVLGLSEPNPEKLKLHTYNIFGDEGKNKGRQLSSFTEHVQDCDGIRFVGHDIVKGFSALPVNTVNVDLTLPPPPPKVKSIKFCSYCDSISIVDKFNPFFQIQWLKCTQSSTNFSSFEQCTTSLVDLPFCESQNQKFDLDNWIFYNLDKSIINFFSATSKQEYILTAPPSTLVTNLLEHVQLLMDNCRESEIEQFVNIQLGFIRKLGEDFGKMLQKVTKFDVSSMPYVGENDLGLLLAVAGYRFPELRERFFI